MATFDDVVRIGTQLPEVTVGTSYGTPGLLVRKKGFCRLWDERTFEREGVDLAVGDVLVVMCDVDEKPMLLDQFPGVLMSTPHYDGYGAMLVRLADVEEPDLADFLEDSYRAKAPATLIKQLDAAT